MENRKKLIMKTSIVGIVTNIMLVIFKAIVGLLSNSIAIIMDAVNNLTDAISSILTLVGIHLAGKDPDKKHPFGHGRTEYLSTLAIAILIVYAGVTAFVNSVKGIFEARRTEYNAVMFIILIVATIAKICLSLYYQKKGKETTSGSLIASGKDAMFDAVISGSTILAAVIHEIFDFHLEAHLGAIISILIIKSGIEIFADIISKLLGEGASVELVKDIKKTIAAHEGVNGAYDLVINNYGQNVHYASVHIEVSEKMSASKIDVLSREITDEIYEKFNVILLAVGVYAYNETDEEVVAMRDKVTEIAVSHEYVKQIHGFYVDRRRKKMRFDMVISFDTGSRAELYEHVISDLEKEFPNYSIKASMDADFNEI